MVYLSNGAKHGTIIRCSEKGYISKELFYEFGQEFVKYLTLKNMFDGRPHVLLMDSHYLHLYNLDFLQLMKDSSIHVFALPPHCSHWMQPLDRGVFKSFKHSWQQEMKRYTRDTAGRKLEKKDFFLVFNPVWDRSMTTENAQGAFRGSGIFPLDIKAIPDHAYDPSAISERSVAPFSATAQVYQLHFQPLPLAK